MRQIGINPYIFIDFHIFNNDFDSHAASRL